MRLHTNKLEVKDVYKALALAQGKGLVANHVGFEVFSVHNSRTHARGFEIQLGTDTKLPGDKRRYKNSGSNGASTVYAATYDEWGYFIAELFAMDEEMIFGFYKSLSDFEGQTKFAYVVEGN